MQDERPWSWANVRELLAAACDERLTPAQWAELDALLRKHESVRMAYLKRMQLEAHLRGLLRVRDAGASGAETQRWMQALSTFPLEGEDVCGLTHGDCQGSSLHDAMILPALADEADAARKQRAAEQPPAVVSIERETSGWGQRLGGSNWRVRLASAAAVIAVGILMLLGVMLHRDGSPAVVVSRPPVKAGSRSAVLSQTLAAQWEGEPVPTGEDVDHATLRLKSGLAKVIFPNGAAVVLQGPARLRVDGESHVTLGSGRLTTHVPTSAVGFTVATPLAALVDLGTEFGVRVDANRQVHAEVFTGRAMVRLPNPGGTTGETAGEVLTKGMAVRVNGGGRITPASPEPLAFVRVGAMQEQVDAAEDPLARWRAFSRPMRADPHLIAYYPFDQGSRDAGELLNRAEHANGEGNGTLTGVSWGEGRFAGKLALRFSGSSSRIRVHIPGKFRQATFAAWVNIHSYPRPYGSLICSDNQGTPEIAHWVFSQKFAPMGLELSVMKPDGRTWIREYHYPLGPIARELDQWHFFATCYDSDTGVVTSWFDGKPAGAVKINHPQAITIGSALIGCWENNGSYYRGLFGRMDELAIWDRALSAAEIQEMYAAGAAH